MGKFIDVTGQKFNRFTVLRIAYRNHDRIIYWLCRCECGNEVAVNGHSLRRGHSRSCGCYKAGAVSLSNTTHGHTKNYSTSKEYKTWVGMRNRCSNPKDPHYKDYGARGITVCAEWANSFGAFIAHVGVIPKDGKKYTLDRIDNNQGYAPGNVRWTDQLTQANNKRNSVMLTAFGRTQTLPQWSRETGLCKKTLKNRILSGWAHERAVSEPLHHKGNRSKSAELKEILWGGDDFHS